MLPRSFFAFWIFGLVNNVLYVVILSAAIDLVGPEAPKAIVLLADVMPSFVIKFAAPFFIHKVPYKVRISSLVALSSIGMLVIAYSERVGPRLFGVILASLSSGLGEISFLQLTHFYSEWSLPGFSSGTGAAGLVGSFAFLLMTTWVGLSTKATLTIFSAIPFAFWVTYAFVLPPADPNLAVKYDQISDNNEEDDTTGVAAETSMRATVRSTVDRLLPLILPYMYVSSHSPVCLFVY
jgi:battenin